MLRCRFHTDVRSICLSRSRKIHQPLLLSRRKFLQYCQGASAAFLPAGLQVPGFFSLGAQNQLPDILQLHPQYRINSGMEAILKKVPAGYDEFITEKYCDEIDAVLDDWSSHLRESPLDTSALAKVLSPRFGGCSMKAAQTRPLHEKSFAKIWKVTYPQETPLVAEAFLSELRASLASFSNLLTAEFQVISINAEPNKSAASTDSVSLATIVRFELVGTGDGFHREQRVGHWQLEWELNASQPPQLLQWRVLDESRSRALAPVFQDITVQAFGGSRAYTSQLIPGTDYWRTVLDSATGIDIYGHNGVSVGDADGDGFDDLYICQPAGLPNRLFRNRGDGTFEDITESSGVGVLENTSCALFADIDNDGRQDLIVVCATGPLLFLNQGEGKFRLKLDAFHFATTPQGTFTGAAIADYDRDGWLDIYFCLYAYYQGTDQYRYPMPYFDAENGPPNFLMRNNRGGTFVDVTKQSGLDKNNTRFTFCCAWNDFNQDSWPDLYVVNDFGRKNLYRNNGDGTFTDVAAEMGVEDVGAGMSGAWFDCDNDGRDDLYVGDMWTAAGLRVSMQDDFQKNASPGARRNYQRHAMGNSLYRNLGSRFEDAGVSSGTKIGRWSWCCDSWDFDHDGYPDLYVANGMISGPMLGDLNSFFWRQVVANSPNEPRPSHLYEQAWNAINELIRADHTWSGFERNVFYLNQGNGTFADVSGIVGMDFIEDSRSFALGDFDHDGRLEVILKNRNSPQLRYLKNVIAELPPAISFRLTGKKSNRDAVGARLTVETDAGRQTRSVQAGSGFLAQHTKEICFGLGPAKSVVRATIQWPSGLKQDLHDLPLNHRVWLDEGQPPSRLEPFKPVSSPPLAAPTKPSSSPEILPRQVETWLLVPIPAPEFSLPDLTGRTTTLSSYRGKPLLLFFWSPSTAGAEKDLKELERLHTDATGQHQQVLAINVDYLESEQASQVPPSYATFDLPILRGSSDVMAIYNLLFRRVFDRHRDMSVPTSFLLDSAGSIVKLHQGPPTAEHVAADVQTIPRNDAERLSRALPFPGATEAYEYGRNQFSLGFEFYDHGYFEEAATFFQQALKDDPQSAEAYYGLGSAYLQLQKADDARQCFERALQLHATYPGTVPNAWNNLGILSAREGNTDVAIQQFQRALQSDPEHPIALQNLGSAYRQKKDWRAAKQALEHSLALNPDDPETNYSLGMVYAQQNDTQQAEDYLQKALAERSVYPEALNNLGILYLRTRRPEDALRSFEECMRVAPAYDQAYLNLARVYAIEGDRQKAKAVLEQLLQQHPGHPQATEELKQLSQ
jgi:tetratricopeptide (TPR) repeat protein/peroxiredoxin